MKKLIQFTATLILILLSLHLNATVWRVNPTPGASAVYTSLQVAHDAITTLNGDTLYLEGSLIAYGGLTCTKQLIILGAGYYLNENPDTQSNTSVSNINDYVYLNAGSAYTKIMGCRFSSPVYINVSNITLERNIFMYGEGMVTGNVNNLTNINILRNYFSGSAYGTKTDISFDVSCTNILISNNYISENLYTGPNFYGIITNNIFESYITIYNSLFMNNIYTYPSNANNYGFDAINCVVTNNISAGTQFGNQNGNMQSVSMSSVFAGTTGNSTDGQWVLLPGSPAIGAGQAGVDCGIFGGAYPYILSGMPPIPAVYYYNAPPIPSDVINVSIKAKSHN